MKVHKKDKLSEEETVLLRRAFYASTLKTELTPSFNLKSGGWRGQSLLPKLKLVYEAPGKQGAYQKIKLASLVPQAFANIPMINYF